MTGKRFEMNNDIDFNDKVETYELNCIRDNDNKTFYFIADSLENVQLFIKRLNALHEENEQLKKELFETSKELLWATSDDVDRALYFENEVEDLRKEIFE